MKQTQEHIQTECHACTALDYFLYLPDAQPTSGHALPLLLFLHGMGERGNDISLIQKHGPPSLIESGVELPFIVVAPQCPAGSVWENDVLIALLDNLQNKYDVDRQRIYVTGLSMGGAGTWSLANACPGRFAAIAPICGPFTMVDPTNFTDLPVWCFHGAMDDVVPVTDSVRMVRSLRNSGSDVRVMIYPDAGHNSWTEAYEGTTLYDWLLTHRRP